MNEMKPFRVETPIEASAEEVWRALTKPELIRQWFGWDFPGIEPEIQEIFVDGARKLPGYRLGLAADQEITLTSKGDTTTITVVMPGPLDDAKWDDIYDGMEEGWRTFFEQLRFYLQRHRDGRRRTLYLTGTANGPAVLTAIKDHMDGEPWHDSRYQRMTVDNTGNLIGVAAQRPLDSTDDNPMSITVTTYDLTDTAFDHLRQQWTERWRSIASGVEVV